METAPAPVSAAAELPARVRGGRRYFLLSLVFFLFLYLIGVLVLNTTPQHTALHGTAVGGFWIGLTGAFGAVWLLEIAPQQFRPRQLAWAAIPVVSLGFLAFVPFAWVAIVRRRARDWAVAAVYLVAVAAFAAVDAGANGSTTAYKSVTVMLGGLVVIGSVHALLAVSPAAPSAGSESGTMPPLPAPAARRRVAYAGAGLALLAGIVGLISEVTFSTGDPPDSFSSAPLVAVYLLIAAVAIAALCGINRLVIVGLLQGMCWPAVAYAVADIASVHAGVEGAYAGSFLAAYWILIASDVLGAAAAIVLLVSWTPAVALRRGSRRRPPSLLLRWSVGLGQCAAWACFVVIWKQNAVAWTLGVSLLLVGGAVTWYALKLRASALGGALVLGWATVIAFMLIWSMSPWTVADGFGCVFLVSVMILAMSYARGPSDTDPSLLPQVLTSDEVPESSDEVPESTA